ncbi:MAG: circadian clock KaiB family protein, partial [Phormidesmis sp. CAN_BIN36]|nr:circadian clock KaiB family protein [Phormidesmis sp. CAN_BIN36]
WIHTVPLSIGKRYRLKVTDIFTHLEQAEIDRASATPTRVKVCPHPVRRIVGDLSDVNWVRMLGAPGER